MLTAAQSATDGGTVTQRVTYAYDAFGSRIQRQGWDGTTTTTERYGLDGWDTAKPSPVGNESFDAWVEMDGGNTLTLRRISGVGFDENVARQTAGGTVNWYLNDHQRSVRAVIDNSGSIVNTTTFSSTGVIVAGTLFDRMGYTGQSHDSITGFVGMGEGTREYDAATSRFLSHDPKGFAAGDANLYRYVGNSPTNATDPSGMTLYVPAWWADAWEEASWVDGPNGPVKTIERDVSKGQNGFVALKVSDAGRTAQVYEALAKLVPDGVSVHDTMVALYDGNLSKADPNYSHDLYDKVLVPSLNDVTYARDKRRDDPFGAFIDSGLDKNKGYLLPAGVMWNHQALEPNRPTMEYYEALLAKIKASRPSMYSQGILGRVPAHRLGRRPRSPLPGGDEEGGFVRQRDFEAGWRYGCELAGTPSCA